MGFAFTENTERQPDRYPAAAAAYPTQVHVEATLIRDQLAHLPSSSLLLPLHQDVIQVLHAG